MIYKSGRFSRKILGAFKKTVYKEFITAIEYTEEPIIHPEMSNFFIKHWNSTKGINKSFLHPLEELHI